MCRRKTRSARPDLVGICASCARSIPGAPGTIEGSPCPASPPTGTRASSRRHTSGQTARSRPHRRGVTLSTSRAPSRGHPVRLQGASRGVSPAWTPAPPKDGRGVTPSGLPSHRTPGPRTTAEASPRPADVPDAGHPPQRRPRGHPVPALRGHPDKGGAASRENPARGRPRTSGPAVQGSIVEGKPCPRVSPGRSPPPFRARLRSRSRDGG